MPAHPQKKKKKPMSRTRTKKLQTWANFAAYWSDIRRTGVTKSAAKARWAAMRDNAKLAEDDDDKDKPFGGKKAKPFGKKK